MGYYTGAGVTSGGSESANLRSNGPAIGGAYFVYQRVISSTNVKHGVSLATAQSVHGGSEMNFWTWPGGMVEPGSRGTRTSVSYSQISGSNLYTLQVTTETIQVRGKQGTYDSGWVS